MTSVIKALKHCNADVISRLPVVNLKPGHSDEEYDSTESYMIHLMDSLPVDSKEVKRETLRDLLLKLVYEMTMTRWPENVEQGDLKAYFLMRNEISIHQRCLVWVLRVLIPIPFSQEH